MDVTAGTETGSGLLSFDPRADIGVFDGRIMTDAATHTGIPPALARAAARSAARLMALGALLVALGVVAVAYAGFQLFGTGFLAAQGQSRLADSFEARLAGGLAPIDDPSSLTTQVLVETPDPDAFDDADDVPVVLGPVVLEPPIPDPAEIASAWVYEQAPGPGEPVGRLVIPKFDLDWLVIEGVGVADLRQGPGHMPNSAMPGQAGNAVISGHRTTYGAPFNRLDELEPGDRFTVETLSGVHTYEVVSLEIVRPWDSWVTSQWAGAWLTFTTCHPEYSSRQRLVVFSKLVEGPNAAAAATLYGTAYQPPVAPPTVVPPPTPTTTTTVPDTTTSEATTTTTVPDTTTSEATTTTTTTLPDTTTTSGA